MLPLETPILLIIFNRPDLTRQVFDSIRRVQPRHLYVAADGPRNNQPGEMAKCAGARAVIDGVDWDCEVHRLFSAKNQGCKIGVSSAIDWFFSQEEAGIILEDDCLPDQSFFAYGKELLEKYRDDQRVMMIAGSNFQDGIIRGGGSYYFSQFCHIWGWATWRRAWQKNDIAMTSWPKWRDTGKMKEIWPVAKWRRSWTRTFDRIYQGKIDTWDYAWVFAAWSNRGLCAVPNKNLISNIGFGQDATHTKTQNYYANQKTESLGPIIHPVLIEADISADRYTYEHLFATSLTEKVINELKSLFLPKR